MDLPEADPDTKRDYTFMYTIYGFLALLGFCFVFSLGKAIYHYYKVRATLNVAATEDSINTECHSVSNEDSISDRQTDNTDPDSDRLSDQLDKLRRLLNRLNAMGTFSRDTIGDLSAQSAAYKNNSVAASSDLSAFWSSISFDDFEESTINEGNFLKTPTEKSVSPSVSDFSLDTSGIHFDNFHKKNIATSSKEYVVNSGELNVQTNPSDAIVQILAILESITQKSKNNAGLLQNNTLKIEKNCDKSTNIKALSRSTHSMESYVSQKRLMPSSSTVSMDKNSSAKCKSFNSDSLVSTSGNMTSDNLNTEPKSVENSLSPKPSLLDQLSQFIDSQYRMSSTISVDAKISKGISVVNIASSSGSKSFYASQLSTSSKSLDAKKLSVSRSVAVYIDPVTCLSTQVKEISELSLAVPKEPNLLANENAKKMLSEECVTGISPCTIDIEVINRSHSLSDLLDKSLQTLSIPLNTDKSSDQQKTKSHDFSFEKMSLPVIIISEPPRDTHMYSTKNNEKIDEENANHKNRTLKINNNRLTSISSKSLHSPVFSDSPTMKSSISESDIKQSSFLGMHSSNLSSSVSDEFLTPVVTTDLSPFEKVDWKSPVEPISDIYVLRNLTPHNENAVLSRKSCMWSTPPSPEETTPHEVVKITSTSSIQNLDKCKF